MDFTSLVELVNELPSEGFEKYVTRKNARKTLQAIKKLAQEKRLELSAMNKKKEA